MSNLSSLVAIDGPLRLGVTPGPDVRTLQLALSQAGYRVGQDGEFGPRTDMVVRQFQRQHGLDPDGKVGPITAALLDAPHGVLIANAAPIMHATGFPHDDTASLIAFYGNPTGNLEQWKAANVVPVDCPWTLYYEGREWPHPIPFHRKAAPAFEAAFGSIWLAAAKDDHSQLLHHVRAYSGSGNLRPVRGSSRISTHGFWAAIDFDAEHLPLGHRVPAEEMPAVIVEAFKAQYLFWGGDFVGRPDPMHVQAAHE